MAQFRQTFSFRQGVFFGESAFNLAEIAGPHLRRDFCAFARSFFSVWSWKEGVLPDGIQHIVKTISELVLPMEVAFHRFHARFPAATAWMTLAGPEALSPPAKIPLTDVSSVTGSALKQTTLDIDTDVSKQFAVDGLPIATMI